MCVLVSFCVSDLYGLIRSGDMSAAIDKEKGTVSFSFADPTGNRERPGCTRLRIRCSSTPDTLGDDQLEYQDLQVETDETDRR